MRFAFALSAAFLFSNLCFAQQLPNQATPQGTVEVEKDSKPLTPAQQLQLANKKYQSLESLSFVLNLLESKYVDEKAVLPEALIEKAIKGIVGGLDPHTIYLPPSELREFQSDTSGKFGGVGVVINQTSRLLEVSDVLPDSPAARAGLKPGDVIYSIDGEPLTPKNLQTRLGQIRGLAGTTLEIEVIPAAMALQEKLIEKKSAYPLSEYKSKAKTIKMKREVIHTSSVFSTPLAQGYGYISLSIFQEDTAEKVDKALTELEDKNGGKLKGIVIDLRDNPGGLFDQAVRIADLFLDSGIIVSTIGREKSSQSVEYATKRDTHPDVPIVILVNEKSASASEILAGALQDHNRAIIMGSTTFGKGSVQQIVQLPNGGGLKLTIARYYTPKGKSIQAKGIVPDIVLNAAPGKDAKAKNGVRKEADLDGHIDASDLREASMSSSIVAEMDKWPARIKQDDAVRSAFSYLKGWERFKKQ